MKKIWTYTFTICGLVLLFSGQAWGEGNRFGLPRLYHSEISAAQAYILLNHDQGNMLNNEFAGAELIDVRKIGEYVAGHPYGAWNIPYPHINGIIGEDSYIGQLPENFIAAVEELFPDRETPLLTLCKTGYRSVLAANLLAGVGYVNVRPIWHGFIGLYSFFEEAPLDLNNDGVINEADKDGWANFQKLPWTTDLVPKKLLYLPYYDLY